MSSRYLYASKKVKLIQNRTSEISWCIAQRSFVNIYLFTHTHVDSERDRDSKPHSLWPLRSLFHELVELDKLLVFASHTTVL